MRGILKQRNEKRRDNVISWNAWKIFNVIPKDYTGRRNSLNIK